MLSAHSVQRKNTNKNWMQKNLNFIQIYKISEFGPILDPYLKQNSKFFNGPSIALTDESLRKTTLKLEEQLKKSLGFEIPLFGPFLSNKIIVRLYIFLTGISQRNIFFQSHLNQVNNKVSIYNLFSFYTMEHLV